MKAYKAYKAYLNLTLISTLTAILILNSSDLLFAQNLQKESEVAFTFGKIEVLKRGISEWEFLKKGDVLQPEDIVRMPPASILRLKLKDDINLPMVTGSREQDAAGLIAYAKGSMASQIPRKIMPESNSTADIDALPVGSYSPYKKENSEDQSQKTEDIETKLDAKQLKLLKQLVQSKMDLIKDSVVKKTHDIPTVFNSYPGSNVLKAKLLFQMINDLNEEKKSNFEIQTGFGRNVDQALIICSLLQAASVESELQLNDEGKLFVIFDSGVPNSQFKKLTVNRKLTYLYSNQNIWIPLHLNLKNLKKGEPNFIQAWYNGSEIAIK